MATTTNENHDKIWAIVRDAMNNAIGINDAVAKIKGLQDGTELTEENYEMADNVNPDKNTEEQNEVQDQAIQNELAFGGTVDPGKDADADINDIVNVDETDDTATMKVVPDDQLVSETTEVNDNVVTTKTTEDGAKAEPASESNEVAPASGDLAQEEEKPQTRAEKKAARKQAVEEAKN